MEVWCGVSIGNVMGYPWNFTGFTWVWGVRHVALDLLIFLQFFSLKSIEKWLSYTPNKFEEPSPNCDHMTQHLISMDLQKSEIVWIWSQSSPKGPLWHQFFVCHAKTWKGCRLLNSLPFSIKEIAKCRENLDLHDCQSKTREIPWVTHDIP